jgi:hypothetical protein
MKTFFFGFAKSEVAFVPVGKQMRAPSSITRESGQRIDSQIQKLYGTNKLEIAPNKAAKKDETDADSIVSEDSGKDKVTLQERVDSQLYIIRETKSGRQLWKCPLKESDDIADHIAAANKSCYRVCCHSFRSMIPPLVGDPPIRSPIWLRHCSRGALQSYLEDRLSSHENHGYRTRFPEHVYCWFSDNGNNQAADEDRWAFYYGLKLESSNPEYWLTHSLLDDMHGEDFSFFLAQSIDAIHKQTGKSWDQLFGEISSCKKAGGNGSKSQLTDGIRQGSFCALNFDGVFDLMSTAYTVWIPVEIAKGIAHQLFHSDWIESSKYVEELCLKVTKAVMDIENLSSLGVKEGSASQHEPMAADASSIELFTFLQLILKTHLSHKKKQVTLIKLMFETASQGVLTDNYGGNKSNRQGYKDDLISVLQLYEILNTIWKSMTLEETTLIFREAYDALYPPSHWSKPAPDGINFSSFLVAVDRLALFSRLTFPINK